MQALETKGKLEKQSGPKRTKKRAKSLQYIECKGIMIIFRANRSICNKTKGMQEPVRFVTAFCVKNGSFSGCERAVVAQGSLYNPAVFSVSGEMPQR